MKETIGVWGCAAAIHLFVLGFGLEGEAAVILESSLSVYEAYTDNLFFTEEDTEREFVTVVSPELVLGYGGKFLAFSATYRGAAEFHSRFPGENLYAQQAEFDIGLPLAAQWIRGLEVRIIEDLSYTPELPAVSFAEKDARVYGEAPSGDFEILGEGVQLQRTDTLRNRAGVDVTYAATSRFTASLSYQNIVTRYTESEFEDTVVNKAGLGGRYEYEGSPRTTWTASYELAGAIYPDDEEVGHQIQFGVRHLVTRFLTADAAAGAAMVQGESPQFISEAGLVRRFRDGRLSFRYENQIELGEGVVQEAYLTQQISGDFDQALGKTVAVWLRAVYEKNDSLSGNQLDVSVFTAESGITVGLLSWLTGSLAYSYLSQQSEGAIGGDGRRNLVMAMLTAGGPSWRVLE